MIDYSRDHACQLRLDSGRIPDRPDYERWVLVMLDEQGRETYRCDITERDILEKNDHVVDIFPARVVHGTPVRYFLWPRLIDHTFTDMYHFDLPAPFMERIGPVLEWLQRTPVPNRTVTCDIVGGLGNQLFQVMTTLVFAADHGYTPVFDVANKESPSMAGSVPTYWDNLLKNTVDESRRSRCNYAEQWIWSEPSFMYHPIPELSDHMRLYGYFTSFRYFDHAYDDMSAAIRSNEDVLDEVDAAFEDLAGASGANARPVVSLHVRRGDSLKNPTLEKPDVEYYRKAQARFEGVDFLVFSDDVAWCKRNLDGERLRFVEGYPDYVDLLLMSKCDHHIIANSTFSWWGAYLNPSGGKRVVFPYPWYRGEKHARDFRDFIPREWVPVQSRSSGRRGRSNT